MHEAGVWTEKKESVPFNVEEAEQLWSKNVFDVRYPAGLQRAIFFHVGKVSYRVDRNSRTSNFPSSRDSKILCVLNIVQK